jgi:hypothetical protein
MRSVMVGVGLLFIALAGCSGLKVVKPEQNKDAGTLMIDWSGSKPQVVGTHGCSLKTIEGKTVSALGKTEEEARREVLARCRDKSLFSVCNEKKVTCTKN